MPLLLHLQRARAFGCAVAICSAWLGSSTLCSHKFESRSKASRHLRQSRDIFPYSLSETSMEVATVTVAWRPHPDRSGAQAQGPFCPGSRRLTVSLLALVFDHARRQLQAPLQGLSAHLRGETL